jgi:hypothetical protein
LVTAGHLPAITPSIEDDDVLFFPNEAIRAANVGAGGE